MRKISVLPFFAIMMPAAYGIGIDTDSPKTITAPKIEYDVRAETIQTTGKTEIVNDAGQRMTLVDSYLSKDGSTVSGADMEIWLGAHVYVESDDIVRDGDITTAHGAMFTACANCDSFGNAWEITASTVIHDMSDRMLSFHNPVFWTYGLPVLWFPYYSMPDPGVKHKTGFLMPDFGSTNNMGTQINVPFHISLSEYHDATVTLSYLTQENPLFQGEHRLNLAHSEYRTHGAYTHNKAGEDRWYIFNNDVIELGEYARASVYLERASDKTFLQKYGFYDDQPYLDSGAKLELFGQSGYVVADTHVFQELRQVGRNQAAPSGNILPNVRGVYQTDPIYGETYVVFATDVLGIAGDGDLSQRLIGDVKILSPWTLWGGNRITASLSTRYDIYNFENTVMTDGTEFSGLKSRFLPSGYLEWGLPLMRPGSRWMQTIEPRARLTVMRHMDREAYALNNDSAGAFLSDATLFSANRFSGLDLWENGTFADYGVRWAAFDNDGHTTEVFIGQSYDFTDRADTDPNSGFHNGASDYVGRISYSNSKWLSLRTRFRFAEQDLALRHMETSGRIGNGRNFINVGHIWSQQFVEAQDTSNISEGTVGFGLRLSDRWSVQWNAIYNITEGEFQRHTGALYYEHPCYYLSFGYRRDNAVRGDYVGNTTFQFKFGMTVDGQKY